MTTQWEGKRFVTLFLKNNKKNSTSTQASSKSKRDVLLSPDQVREKEKALPKGYAYTLVPVEDPPKASLVTSGKRERKKRVDADFVVCI